jgi:hypothetical protein
MKWYITSMVVRIMTIIIGAIGLVYTVITLLEGSWTGLVLMIVMLIVWPEMAITACKLANKMDERPR